jgi:hypothetical protein
MPSIINSVSFLTNFIENIPVKKFLFTDTTDYTTPSIPTTGVRGVFSITDPSGTVIYKILLMVLVLILSETYQN